MIVEGKKGKGDGIRFGRHVHPDVTPQLLHEVEQPPPLLLLLPVPLHHGRVGGRVPRHRGPHLGRHPGEGAGGRGSTCKAVVRTASPFLHQHGIVFHTLNLIYILYYTVYIVQ